MFASYWYFRKSTHTSSIPYGHNETNFCSMICLNVNISGVTIGLFIYAFFADEVIGVYPVKLLLVSKSKLPFMPAMYAVFAVIMSPFFNAASAFTNCIQP